MAAEPNDSESNEVDGRTARRDRNRNAVLDAVLELFTEDNLEPTPEQVAARSGVSLRSVYRYFADHDELLRAAVARHLHNVEPLFAIHAIGQGTLDERIDRFVTARLRGHETIAATARASRLRAPASPIIRDQIAWGRALMRSQVDQQFAPELAAVDARRRKAIEAAIDTLTQTEALEHYRVHRGFSRAETARLLAAALHTLLA